MVICHNAHMRNDQEKRAEGEFREIIWMGDSLKCLRGFPEEADPQTENGQRHSLEAVNTTFQRVGKTG